MRDAVPTKVETGSNVTVVPLRTHVPTFRTSIVDFVHPADEPSVGVSLAPHSFRVELLKATVPSLSPPLSYVVGITPGESFSSGLMIPFAPYANGGKTSATA